jgi:hypothetical protein
MSFRRFVQHETLKKAQDPYEILRLLILIVKNIIKNPNDIKYKTIRLVKITTVNYTDKFLLGEILVRLNFVKLVSNLEEKFILTKSTIVTREKLDDLNFVMENTGLVPIDKTCADIIKSNTKLINDLNNDKQKIIQETLVKFRQDRETVSERVN